MFQHDAETHAKVREGVLIMNDLPSKTAGVSYMTKVITDYYFNDSLMEVRIHCSFLNHTI